MKLRVWWVHEGWTHRPKHKRSHRPPLHQPQPTRLTQTSILIPIVRHQAHKPRQVRTGQVLRARQRLGREVLLDKRHAEEDAQIHDQKRQHHAPPLQHQHALDLPPRHAPLPGRGDTRPATRMRALGRHCRTHRTLTLMRLNPTTRTRDRRRSRDDTTREPPETVRDRHDLDDPAHGGEEHDPREPGRERGEAVRDADVAEAVGDAGDGQRDGEEEGRQRDAQRDGGVAEEALVSKFGHDAQEGPDGAEED